MKGAEVPQFYLGFPSSASEPPKVLRGFEKVFLEGGQSREVRRQQPSFIPILLFNANTMVTIGFFPYVPSWIGYMERTKARLATCIWHLHSLCGQLFP